jgi:hypothetical protein
MHLCHMNNKGQIACLRAGTSLQSVCLSLDRQKVIAGGVDCKVCAWDVGSEQALRTVGVMLCANPTLSKLPPRATSKKGVRSSERQTVY